MANLEGVDVSHLNGEIDWAQVRDAGISFAMIKVTQGQSFVDPMAQTNLAKCRDVGIVPGLYHFYSHQDDPQAQAQNFIKSLGALQPGDLIPAIDVEASQDGAGNISYPPSEVVRRVGEVVSAVQAAVGRAPMIYTYPSAWQDVTGNSNAFAGQCPLWIASYGADAPRLIGGWTDYTLWQWTDQGNVNGIGQGVDRDRFNGGLAELAAFRLGSLQKGGKAVLNQDGRVHGAPGLAAPQVAVLRAGTPVTIVDGPQPADDLQWWKIDNGAGVAGWSSGKLLSPA